MQAMSLTTTSLLLQLYWKKRYVNERQFTVKQLLYVWPHFCEAAYIQENLFSKFVIFFSNPWQCLILALQIIGKEIIFMSLYILRNVNENKGLVFKSLLQSTIPE